MSVSVPQYRSIAVSQKAAARGAGLPDNFVGSMKVLKPHFRYFCALADPAVRSSINGLQPGVVLSRQRSRVRVKSRLN